MTAVLDVREVHKHYPGHAAVTGVSLALRRGELFGLLGPSGCGKTTTLRLVAGFERPDSGEILLNGERIDTLPPYRRSVTTVFQNYALFPHLTVRGNVEFGLRRHGIRDCDARVAEALEMVQLRNKDTRLPAQLSGGERQRVALARALVLRPEVVLLDEPLSALDPGLRRQVRAELKELQRKSGVTFLFVTHDQEEALSLSDRIAVMNAGRIEQTGTPRELYARPGSRFVAGFLGAVNWIDGVGVRPAATRLARHEGEANGRRVPARVEHTTFLGNCVHVHSRLASGEAIVAEMPVADGRYAAGDAVHVWWLPADEMRLP